MFWKSRLPITNRQRSRWDFIVFVTVGVAAFEIPYSAAFGHSLTGRGGAIFDGVFALIFGLDVLVNAVTVRPESHAGAFGYRHVIGWLVPTWSPQAQKRRAGFRTRTLVTVRETMWSYITSWWFVVDVISAIPWTLVTSGAQVLSIGKLATVYRLLRFLRFVRLLKAGNLLHVLRTVKVRFPAFNRVLFSAFALPWVIHVYTCLFYTVEWQARPAGWGYFDALSASVLLLVGGEASEAETRYGHMTLWLGIAISIIVVSTMVANLAAQFIAWDLNPRDRARDYREGHTLLLGWGPQGVQSN